MADYHADTSPLVQMLRKGHHNVRLDEEAWDRLVTWIDMNAPAYGTWLEIPTVRNRSSTCSSRRSSSPAGCGRRRSTRSSISASGAWSCCGATAGSTRIRKPFRLRRATA